MLLLVKRLKLTSILLSVKMFYIGKRFCNQLEKHIARWLNWVVRMKYILNAFQCVVVKLEEEKCREKKLLE